MRITFIRHAETTLNDKNLFSGITEVDITSDGHKAAKELANSDYFLAGFDAYYVSPLVRTSQTLEAMYPGVSPIIDSRITEISLGDWEGLEKTSVDQTLRKDFLAGLYTQPGGEAHEDVCNRLKSFTSDVFKKYPDNASVLVVTHGGVIRTLKRIWNIDTSEKTKNLGYIILNSDILETV